MDGIREMNRPLPPPLQLPMPMLESIAERAEAEEVALLMVPKMKLHHETFDHNIHQNPMSMMTHLDGVAPIIPVDHSMMFDVE